MARIFARSSSTGSLKSLGHDQTFARSLAGLSEVSEALKVHAGVVARALRDGGRVARTLTVIVRFDDRTSVSRSQTLPFGVDDEHAIETLAVALVQSVDLSLAVRLLALHASGFLERGANPLQLSFGIEASGSDAAPSAEALSLERQVGREALRDAIDEIRRRYGRTSLATASELGRRRPRRRDPTRSPRVRARVRGRRRYAWTVTSVPMGVWGKTVCAEAKGISTQPRLCGQP